MAPLDQQNPSGGDTRDELTAVRERVRAEMEAAGLSQARAAAEADVSPTTLSQFLSGTYGGDNLKTASKLQAWLDGRAARGHAVAAVAVADRWYQTPTGKKIRTAIQYAHMLGDVSIIFGGAGVGKTTALRAYAAAHPNVWIVTADPTTSGLQPCLLEVALTLGIKEPASFGSAWLKRAIADRVRNTGGLLAVDEAQHLSLPALEALRAIHDATGIGLALIGNAHIYDRLHGGPKPEAFAQLFSRLGRKLRLARPVDGDVDPLAKAHAFDDPACVEFLRDKSKEPGALRQVVKTMRYARLLASGEETAPELRHLQIAWRELNAEAAAPGQVAR